jgi:NitT/TauT family transport system ATP-binding protein
LDATRPLSPDRSVVVSLRDVSKVFSTGTLALQHLDLDIYEGEILSLLGPSGCGKSTALRIIAGLGDASGGRIVWTGGASSDHSRDVGFVFQEPILMPWASVFDNVWLPSRLKGQSRSAAKEEIMQALDSVGLNAFANAYPRELSGGMRMRVSIARALVTRPKLLLMDEPFAALDEITRHRLNDDLLRIQGELGWTVVFVTHSVFESVYISDRIIVMAARPGRAFSELAIRAKRPRSADFRASDTYVDYCRQASATLTAAIGGAAETVDGH